MFICQQIVVADENNQPSNVVQTRLTQIFDRLQVVIVVLQRLEILTPLVEPILYRGPNTKRGYPAQFSILDPDSQTLYKIPAQTATVLSRWVLWRHLFPDPDFLFDGQVLKGLFWKGRLSEGLTTGRTRRRSVCKQALYTALTPTSHT